MYTNGYIFRFAIIMVVIVGALLTAAAKLLEPRQDANVRIEKIQDMLAAANIPNTKADAEATYNSHIIKELLIDFEGNELVSLDPGQLETAALTDRAFNVDLKILTKEIDKFKLGEVKESPRLPLFVFESNGDTLYIIPVRGKGLWGPIWGNIALYSDLNTIAGVSFDHKSETPGLGAEINLDWFEKAYSREISTDDGPDRFTSDMSIFDDSGKLVGVLAIKGGAADDDPHGVDAISGGTITSVAVNAMVLNYLTCYESYFTNHKK